MVVQGAKTHWDAKLAVVAEWAAVHRGRFRQQASNPFFDRGFPIASRNGQNGAEEGTPLMPGHFLHRQQHITHNQDIGLLDPILFNVALDDKPAHPCLKRFECVVVPIVPWPSKREKHSVAGVL